MAREQKKVNEDLVLVNEAARNEWASRVINTLLSESENGNMTMPAGYTTTGISIQRNYDDTGWNINFQIREAK